MPGGATPSNADDATRLFQLVLDNIPQFIFWKDRNSVYLGCNQNFARVAGVGSPSAIVGKTDFDLAWKREEAEFFRQVDAEVMTAGVGRYQIVEPQLQADGREAWLETSMILENLGLDVLTASGGAEGVARLAGAPGAVDVAIVDVLMPEMSGRDCYWALKAIRPELPIIMASGFTDDQLIEDITLDGAAAFLKKPFGHDALRSALARVLGAGERSRT